MKRIHVPNHGPDESKVAKALAVALREGKVMGSSEVTIITPAKDDLDTIAVGKALGAGASKKLMKGEPLEIPGEAVKLRHESVATVRKGATPKVGVAFYVSEKDIKKLDDLAFDCLVYVPWIDEEGQAWAAKWDAETVGGQTQRAQIDLPAEVVTALTSLSILVNLSTGLSHPSDKEHAKRTFSDLRSKGIGWNPAEVEKWAARNKWRVADAKELAELSAKYVGA